MSDDPVGDAAPRASVRIVEQLGLVAGAWAGRIAEARLLLDRALAIFDAMPGEQDKEDSARVLSRDVALAEAGRAPTTSPR